MLYRQFFYIITIIGWCNVYTFLSFVFFSRRLLHGMASLYQPLLRRHAIVVIMIAFLVVAITRNIRIMHYIPLAKYIRVRYFFFRASRWCNGYMFLSFVFFQEISTWDSKSLSAIVVKARDCPHDCISGSGNDPCYQKKHIIQ